MDKRPRTLVEMSPEEIRARLHVVNDEIMKLTSNLNQISKPFQESTQGDDDAVESEGVQQAFGTVQQRLASLRLELMELEARLTAKAA